MRAFVFLDFPREKRPKQCLGETSAVLKKRAYGILVWGSGTKKASATDADALVGAIEMGE
jgi:hypothetical protein